MNGWVYYNHAVIPECSPHEEPDTATLSDGSLWKRSDGVPLFARWTTDFDYKQKTSGGMSLRMIRLISKN